jgi:hypothetical protein
MAVDSGGAFGWPWFASREDAKEEPQGISIKA